MDYFTEAGLETRVKNASFSAMNPKENERNVLEFFSKNTDVRGIAIMNSRGYIIADILKEHRINDIRMISFDLTTNNVRCLNDGSISVLLCQRPELQGFQAIKSVISKLLYNQEESVIHHIMPIDVLLKDNLPYYAEYLSL